jgi:hypothetical protein
LVALGCVSKLEKAISIDNKAGVRILKQRLNYMALPTKEEYMYARFFGGSIFLTLLTSLEIIKFLIGWGSYFPISYVVPLFILALPICVFSAYKSRMLRKKRMANKMSDLY